jgi:hypothetical protein
VSSSSATVGLTGLYSLTANVTVPSIDGFCPTATLLAPGATLLGQQTQTGGPPLPVDQCASNTGLNHYYSLTLPAGAAANIIVAPTGFVPSVRVLNDCTGSFCVATGGSAAGSQIVPLRNTAANPQSYLIAVGSGTGTGSFDITALIRTIYVESTITPACDVMTGATTLLSTTTTPAISDDVTTGLVPLPFGFPYYGTLMTHYSVNTNGMAQLYSGGGAPVAPWNNVAIPNSTAPNGFLALFWDDLVPQFPDGRISAATFGTAPNRHLTLEWDAVTPIFAGGDHLTFQAHLFETTGVIEFHYCNLGTNSAAATGARAAIGIEDPAGTEGVQHSFNLPNAVSVTQALRFTP